MTKKWTLAPEVDNIVLIGEAGSGKSEISLNIAMMLAREAKKDVCFFDLDMTKPLFRTREQKAILESFGIKLYYEEQFMDAPTLVGGVRKALRDDSCYTIMDVGGDYIGARSLGGYAPLINRENVAVFYIVNNYRPWSTNLEHIDAVLSQTLGVSHIKLERLKFVGNPNIGEATTVEDVVCGVESLRKSIGSVVPLEYICVKEELVSQIDLDIPVLPIKRYIKYDW